MQKQTRDDKKRAEECYFIVKAMQYCDHFPKGELQKHEHPDFLITQDDGRRIGIEVTRYFRGQEKTGGSALRRDEEVRQQIADAAKRLYESKSTIPLRVFFSPCNKLRLKGKRIEQVASALVGVVIDNLANVGDKGKTIYLCESENPLFQNVVSSLSITRLRGTKSSGWGFVEAGFTCINDTAIQDRIDKKHNKLKKYRRYCDEVWLLIVAAGNKISSSIDTDGISRLADHKFYSKFDRVLFYDDYNKRVTPLTLTVSAALPPTTNAPFSNAKSPPPTTR